MKKQFRSAVVVLLTGALFLCGNFSVAAAQSGTVKIATINMKEILSNSKAGKEAEKRLKTKADDLQSRFSGEQQELEKLKEEIEKKSSVWSADVRAEKERDFQKKVREFQAKTEDAKFELQQLDNKETGPILEALGSVINEIAKRDGYTLVLDNTAKGIRSRIGLLYAEDSLDISQTVAKELDKKLNK